MKIPHSFLRGGFTHTASNQGQVLGVSRPELLHDQRLPEMVHSIRDAHLVPEEKRRTQRNRTLRPCSEAQEDILYPMGPLFDFYHVVAALYQHCAMILSSSEILRRSKAGDLIIDPYHSASLQAASYDLSGSRGDHTPRAEDAPSSPRSSGWNSQKTSQQPSGAVRLCPPGRPPRWGL